VDQESPCEVKRAGGFLSLEVLYFFDVLIGALGEALLTVDLAESLAPRGGLWVAPLPQVKNPLSILVEMVFPWQ
jgi:hypothetical protein